MLKYLLKILYNRILSLKQFKNVILLQQVPTNLYKIFFFLNIKKNKIHCVICLSGEEIVFFF